MKDQILKLAGVKSEAAFYKKFPSEAAFMKVHGKALKKAAMGAKMVKDQLTQLTDFSNPPMAQVGINQGPNYTPQNFQFNPLYQNQNQFGQVNPMNLPAVGAPNLSQYGQSQMGAQARGYGQMMNQFGNTGTVGKAAGSTSKGLGPAAGYIQPAMDLAQGISMIKQQKDALKEAEQETKLTGVQAQAASTRPQPINRQYNRPEDYIIQPEQLFPTYGVGTNVLGRNGLTLQDGGPVGGNPTEIQNTYDPNSIYTDLGYEPLNDSTQLKQYQLGGDIGQGGFGDFMNAGGTDMLGNLTNLTHGKRGPSAGNQIGKGIGGGIGTMLGGPLGGVVGGALGDVVGGMFDKTGKKIDAFNEQSDQNINRIIGQQFGQGLQNQYSSYMEDGGYVSNDWTPQVITTFGEHKLKDLLRPPHDADMLRAGGNLRSYTAPSERAMQTYAMGGELQVYKGEAEPISTNPYLPDGGETIMFRGPSHANGGMPITYGQSPVEVEGGEPAVKLQDGGTGEDNLVVFGNLKIPNQFLSEIGDPKAKGKKFKNYVNDLSKIEARQNKIVDKSTNLLNSLDVNSSFDKMKLDSLNANIMGANMKLKDIADKKQNAAAVQSAINDTAEENGLVADDLAKGKVRQAKLGAAIRKAQTGVVTDKEEYDTNFIKNIQDAIGIDPKTPGYGKVWGPKSAEAYYKFHQKHLPEPYTKADDEAYYQLHQRHLPEVFKETDAETKEKIDYYKENPKQLLAYIKEGLSGVEQDAMGLTVDGYKYIGKNKQTSSNNNIYKTEGVQPGMIDYNAIGTTDIPYFANEEAYKSQWLPKMTQALNNPDIANQVLAGLEAYTGQDAEDVKAVLNQLPTKSAKLAKMYELASDYKPGPFHNILSGLIDKTTPTTTTGETTTVIPTTTTETTKGKFPWMQAVNTLIPYLRPSDAERLDQNQLLGEMYALSQNQLEPVQAQKYSPQLISPYDISYQDIMNQNQADFNAMQRQLGAEPAALSALAAQKYGANEKVLGEQFRQNQAMKAGVYNQNINTLNDAQLKNLGILDTQYGRQAQAKSATKATTQAALSSISDKIAKNKLENRTLATYENLYNYRYDPKFRAQNMNPLAQFNTDVQSMDANELAKYAELLKAKEERENKTKTSKARNGSIVKAIKNL